MNSSWFGPLASFIAVLALIPVALWLLKRTPLGAGAAQAGGMRVVSALALAPQQRVLTVEVGQGEQRVWLVLGVSAAGIRTLHTLAPQAEAPALPPATGARGFAQLLAQARRPAGGEHAG